MPLNPGMTAVGADLLMQICPALAFNFLNQTVERLVMIGVICSGMVGIPSTLRQVDHEVRTYGTHDNVRA